MCDLSVLVEDYLSLAPAGKRELPHTLEECAMRVIIGMLPVLVWIARTAREAAALTATVSALTAQEEQEGRARGRRRKRAERSRIVHLVVWGSPSTGYWTALPFGDNQRQYKLMLDTGSSNTGIIGYNSPGVGDAYDSTTVEEVGTSFTVSYTVGGWTGRRVRDIVHIGDSSFSVKFDLIQEAYNGFFVTGAEWVGIWGMAFSELAKPDGTVTLWEQMSDNLELRDSFSLMLCPPQDNLRVGTVLDEQKSSMDLGGYVEDSSRVANHAHKFTTNIERVSPQLYYSVVITEIKVGNTSVPLDCTEFNKGSSILDSGTTDIYLPTVVFNEVKRLVMEYMKTTTNIPATQLSRFLDGEDKLAFNRYTITVLYEWFPTLRIALPHHSNASQQFYLVIPPRLYLRETTGSAVEKQSAACNRDCSFYYFGVKERASGTVIGAIAMMGFYINFDREDFTVTFWESACSYKDSENDSTLSPALEGYTPRVPVDCTCHDCPDPATVWTAVTYTLPAVSLLLLLCSLQTIHTQSWLRSKEAPPTGKGCGCLRVWVWESLCCGLAGCVKRRVQRKKHRRMDTEEGLLDTTIEESWDGGIISTSEQETVRPIVGDRRLRFDRDRGTATEEGLDGEESKRTGPDSPTGGSKVVDPPPSPCSAAAGSVDAEDREDDHSNDCDSLVRDQVDTRTGAESSKTSLNTSTAQGNHRHGQASNTSIYQPSMLKRLFSRRRSSLESEHSCDSGLEADIPADVKVTVVLGPVMEESSTGAAASERTELVVPYHHKGYLDGIRRGSRLAPVMTHPRVPFNLLKRPSIASPDVFDV